MTNDLTARAQAFLFSEGGTLTIRKLSALLEAKEPEVREALQSLAEHLQGTGLALITTETEASLAVDANTSPIIQKAFERERGEEIGSAGLEVLAIVLYRGPSTRSQIDYIRGVNTSWTIRNLLSRGLLERTGNPEDGREYLYRPTVELMSHLGIRNHTDLPQYAEITSELQTFEARSTEIAESEKQAAQDPSATQV